MRGIAEDNRWEREVTKDATEEGSKSMFLKSKEGSISFLKKIEGKNKKEKEKRDEQMIMITKAFLF